MAVRFCLLISLLGIFWLAFSLERPGDRETNLCLACHQQHYESTGGCALCHRGDSRTGRAEVAHRDLIPSGMAGFAVPGDRKTQYGLRLLDRLACRRCHVWDGQGSRLATDLGQVYFSSRIEKLSSALRNPVEQMPDYALDAGQIEAAVAALLKASRMTGPAEEQGPVTVHFTAKTGEEKHPFETLCGGCHRALSARFGALGSGDVAANLSGLLGEHYPRDWNGEYWTEERLGKWLANPRQMYANSLMQRVLLKEGEAERILEVFRNTSHVKGVK